MRKCTKCGVKHAPPTGKKCALIDSEEETSMPSLEGDSVSEMLNWADEGVVNRPMDNPYSFSPVRDKMGSEWSWLGNHDKKPGDIKREETREGMGTNTIPPVKTTTGKVSFEQDIAKSELKSVKEDVLLVKRDLDRMAAESRTSLAKISHIEDMLRESLRVKAKYERIPTERTTSPLRTKGPGEAQRFDFLPSYLRREEGKTRDGSHLLPAHDSGFTNSNPGSQGNKPTGGHQPRSSKSRGNEPSCVSGTSVYESSSSSASVSPPRRRAAIPDGAQSRAKSRSKRKIYKIERFLPKEERVKPMSNDKLWYCHGSLMLERYKMGKDITGMLEHNCFIAEKVSTKAYLPSGIIKYDEAVRALAREKGDSAYTSGDMGLAMRFLSTEYARYKNSNTSFFQNRQGSVRRQAQSIPARDTTYKGKQF